ncbi:adenosylcobinamide-GDP ribazoletransferase [Enemella evansiae]|uniref:adenosylcobinamide-GDP ribazoletransferase n=1 Tax=Enemella evansiae TaxID=2016499 RepID=UPI000B96D61A|nr:adenosylcobinamide-GDP ribazoletransferase [Enemella evansiae]OYN97415.1 adenosylcobinamide-GDP ribazoletransferase [Enemella evansiae]
MAAFGDGWRWAVGTLTVLPSGRFETGPAAARVMVAVAPLAVLPLALVAAIITQAGNLWGSPDLLTGLLVIGWLALATRAMHVDGLADVADGFGAGWSPERAREVLKRGDIGPMGIIALIVLLGLQAVAIGALAEQPHGWALVGGSVLLSRWAIAICCRAGIPAMPGSQLGRALAGQVPGWLAWSCAAATVAGATLLAWWAGLTPWRGAQVGLTAVMVANWLVTRARRVFGGINGDVMGAAIEVSLTMLLIGWAL